MALRLSEIISSTGDRKVVKVPCPEWGGDVCLLPFSGNDRDWYDQMKAEKMWPSEGAADWAGMRAAAVARGLCNEDGVKESITEEQVAALGERNGAALDRCFAALSKASGLGATADEDAEKNSNPAPSGGTGSS